VEIILKTESPVNGADSLSPKNYRAKMNGENKKRRGKVIDAHVLKLLGGELRFGGGVTFS